MLSTKGAVIFFHEPGNRLRNIMEKLLPLPVVWKAIKALKIQQGGLFAVGLNAFFMALAGSILLSAIIFRYRQTRRAMSVKRSRS